MPKTFSQLTDTLPGLMTRRGDAPISAPVVEADTDLQPGGVFIARRGLNVDGHSFIDRAIARGAAAIIGEADLDSLPVPYARVEDAQQAAGYAAAAYHDHPARRLTVVGVTGTDGKTTTSTLLYSILQVGAGGRAGLISTVAAQIGSQRIDTGYHVTTPGAPQLQALLAEMVAAGLTHAVVEATSHGLAQGRLNGIDFDAAVLTNLTHEHLDFHGTFERYRAAKGRLFAMLDESARKAHTPKISVVNADDPNADYFAAFPADRHLRYGIGAEADFRAVDIVQRPDYTQFFLRPPGRVLSVPLVGSFNVLNTLAAITTAHALGLTWETIERGILQMPAIPGRMERINTGQAFSALVDFAHTPNALEKALSAARSMAAGGRVIAVFGSAGLRDREKRRLMAEIGVRLADRVILTAEDPRTESLEAILATMADAATAAGGVEGKSFWRIPDRGEALYAACQMARPGDVVIACGKGHEQSMAFGSVEYAWDDRDALRAALNGDPLRTLPTAAQP